MAKPQLSQDIKDVQSAVLQAPGVDGLLSALVALSKTLNDSALVVETFAPLDPEQCGSDDLRREIASLLTMADRPDLAERWTPGPVITADNVVAFAAAKGDLAPTAHRPSGVPVSFGSIGGLEEVKAQIRRKIINPFLNKGLFASFKRKAGGGVLMYGPPGCGKTMLARALAHECNARFVNVTAASVLDPLVGNAERRIAELFTEARADKPVVLFFDEVEALAQKRQVSSADRVNTVVSALLNEMDGFDSDNEGVLLLGATNVPWSLDGAFRRPGRFDRTIFVPPPDKIARRFILGDLLKDRPVADDIDVAPAVDRTSGYSGADLSAVVETAVDIAIEASEAAGTLTPVNQSHMVEALKEVKPTTGEWLSQASAFGEHGNHDGLYDDLKAFLKKHGR